MSTRSNLQRKRRRQAKAILWDDKRAAALLAPLAADAPPAPAEAEVVAPTAE